MEQFSDYNRRMPPKPAGKTVKTTASKGGTAAKPAKAAAPKSTTKTPAKPAATAKPGQCWCPIYSQRSSISLLYVFLFFIIYSFFFVLFSAYPLLKSGIRGVKDFRAVLAHQITQTKSDFEVLLFKGYFQIIDFLTGSDKSWSSALSCFSWYGSTSEYRFFLSYCIY